MMRTLLTAALLAVAAPAAAQDIAIDDAYARVSRPGAPTGAMFLTITNTGSEDDRLVAVASPIAQIVELHTHIEEDGMMKMRPVEDGLTLPAGEVHMLERGGDHVMLMRLNQTLETGDVVPLTLTFEKAGDVTVDVSVDNDRDQGRLGNGG